MNNTSQQTFVQMDYDEKIDKAVASLRNEGFLVLQWQTGKPTKKTNDYIKLLIWVKEDGKEYITPAKYDPIGMTFSDYQRWYMKDVVLKWAYLPEGDSNG